MNHSATNLEIFQLLLRVLCDELPAQADALLVHGGIDNPQLDALIIQSAADLYRSGHCWYIVLNGLTKKESYLSYEAYLSGLISKGVKAEAIFQTFSALNTAEESESFLQMAKARNWRTLIIQSMPHHQMRCFLQMVAVMKKNNYPAKVYNSTFRQLDWDMPVLRRVFKGENILGQKDEAGPLISLVQGELERIEKYAANSTQWKKSATIQEGLAYLNKRATLVD